MSRFTGWLGGAAARNPWRTIAIWLILIIALFGLKMAFGGQLQDDYTVPGTSSQAGADFLRAHFPQMSGSNARVVIHDRAGHHLAVSHRAQPQRGPAAHAEARRAAGASSGRLTGAQLHTPAR